MLGHTLIHPGNSTRSDESSGKQHPLSASDSRLENDLLRIDLHSMGGIRRIFDKEQRREVLTKGTGNQFSLYEDLPLAYEAWDIDAYYLEKAPSHPKLISTEVTEEGPVRASIKQVYEGDSFTIVQHIRIYNESRLIEFDTEVDWNPSQKMLRVDFPVNIHAAEANYEIQFGHIARPTHSNTSWDMAKFEVVAHKWADISQPNYGVAILNDCKYGHRIQGNTISLNLLRSPTRPDPEADRHVHQFRYALYPHPGNHIDARVVNIAYEFNVPGRSIQTRPSAGAQKNQDSFIRCSSSNVIVDTIKQAEDGTDLIIRLYESSGIDCEVEITTATRYQQISEVNLMEINARTLKVSKGGHSLRLKFGPFQIRTLRLERTS
jgi:alpha-mannosidase